MALNYPGGYVTKSPPEPTANAAPGIWTMDQALQYIKAGTWPTPPIPDPYFNYTILLLHGDGTNGAQNNTFLDSSTNNFTITRNGNTTQGTFSPFSQTGWSNYFDGTDDYLDITTSTAGDFGTGDFTIEAWIYTTTTTTQQIIDNRPTATAIPWIFYLQQTGGTPNQMFLRFYDGVANLEASIEVLANQWTHVAACRSGSTLKLFVNGVQGYSASNSVNLDTTASTMRIGSRLSSVGNYFYGYISNVRIVKGTAVYTSNFTVPTTPLTAITNTSLLTCQSNRFVDNSTNAFAITVNGNPSVQAFSPLAPTAAYSAVTNGGSGYFDGTGDTISAASNTAFSFGTGDFTIEAWIYPTSLANAPGFTDTRAVSGDSGYAWYFLYSSLYLYSSATDVLFGSATISTNAWTHIALVRNGSTISQYVNGVLDVSATYSGSMTCPGSFIIAGWHNGSTPFTGYISNYRLVKGTAVYTSAFTPPTSPVTAITNTNLLCNFTNAGIIDSTAKNDLETVGNAQIDTGTKKFGTGSMEFDGNGDFISVQSPPSLLALGTGNFTIEFWVNYDSLTSATGNEVWLVDFRPTTTNGVYPVIYTDSSNLYYSVNDTNRITGSFSFSTGTWYHIAIARSGTSTKAFVNGTQVGSTYTDSNNYIVGTNRPVFGVSGYNTSQYQLDGFIDEVRITKGVARYTANFTAPTKAFADQ